MIIRNIQPRFLSVLRPVRLRAAGLACGAAPVMVHRFIHCNGQSEMRIWFQKHIPVDRDPTPDRHDEAHLKSVARDPAGLTKRVAGFPARNKGGRA